MSARLLRWLLTASIFAFAALFALLGLGAHLALGDARRLAESGTQAEATVTELVAAKRSTAYRVSYRYDAAGRSLEASKRSIPYGMRGELRPGAKIPVWYEPAQPGRSTTRAEVAELERWPNRIFFPVAAIALLAWGVIRTRKRRAA